MNFKTKFQISYSPDDANHLLLFLFGFEVLLILGYCIVWIIAPGLEWGPISLFLDVDREVSIPTWFSAIQLFAIGLLLILQARETKQLRFYLFILGLGFMLLSMDESAAIHEKIIDSAKRLDVQWLLSSTFMGSHKAWMYRMSSWDSRFFWRVTVPSFTFGGIFAEKLCWLQSGSSFSA